MPNLDFQIESVDAVLYSASPQLAFKLRVTQAPHDDDPVVPIHSVILRCQVRLEPARRRYTPEEQEALHELFGEPARWGQTVRSTLWANTSISVPAFTERTLIDLPVPCTYDFNIAGTKYFGALVDGEVPLSFLFSGTIFYAGPDGTFQVAQISWEKESAFRLPVRVWQQMMDHYYPGIAWLEVRKDLFDRLQQLKSRRHMPTLEQLLESLLAHAEAPTAEQFTP